MKIKGHTTIELTDVKTGKQRKYESDNMVTNALSKYLEDLGWFNNSPLYTSGTIRSNPISYMLGGLILLDKPLPENANTITIPSGYKMTGNGAYNVVYDGDNDLTELGSWNSRTGQSGWTEDGKYKMVWDFTDIQANGPIACACLTNDNAGYIGIGNSTSESSVRSGAGRGYYGASGNPGLYFENVNTQFSEMYLVHASRTSSTMTFIEYDNIVYNPNAIDSVKAKHMGNTGKIKLQTYKVPLSKFDLRESFPYNTNGGAEYMPVSEVELTVPQAFITALKTHESSSNTNPKTPIHYARHGHDYYIITAVCFNDVYGWMENAGVIGDGVLHILKIAEDNTVTYNSVTLPSDWRTARLQSLGFDNNDNMVIALYNASNVAGERWQLWFHNLLDPTSSDFVLLQEASTAGDDVIIGNCVCNGNYASDGVMLIGGGRAFMYRIDIPNKTIYKTNGVTHSFYVVSCLDDNDLVITGSNNGYIGLSKSQNYIATINNLPETVTKTANEQMKVTYTISFVD